MIWTSRTEKFLKNLISKKKPSYVKAMLAFSQDKILVKIYSPDLASSDYLQEILVKINSPDLAFSDYNRNLSFLKKKLFSNEKTIADVELYCEEFPDNPYKDGLLYSFCHFSSTNISTLANYSCLSTQNNKFSFQLVTRIQA